MNAGDRKDIRRAEKAAAIAARSRAEFVVAAMSTKQGRVWFHSLLSACSIFDGSFSGDALVEAFTKGQRNIGLMIYNDIVSNCPDQFVAMMREVTIQELTDERRAESPDGNDDSDEYPGGADA